MLINIVISGNSFDIQDSEAIKAINDIGSYISNIGYNYASFNAHDLLKPFPRASHTNFIGENGKIRMQFITNGHKEVCNVFTLKYNSLAYDTWPNGYPELYVTSSYIKDTVKQDFPTYSYIQSLINNVNITDTSLSYLCYFELKYDSALQHDEFDGLKVDDNSYLNQNNFPDNTLFYIKKSNDTSIYHIGWYKYVNKKLIKIDDNVSTYINQYDLYKTKYINKYYPTYTYCQTSFQRTHI